MNTTKTVSEDKTVELLLTIPWTDIKSMYETVMTETVSNTEIDGFRKGKAPKEMVEGSVDKTKVYEETIRRLIPKAYAEAIKEQGVSPIIMPQIELKDASEGKDWVVSAKTCERPEVTLGEYRKAVADLKAAKIPKIIVPGKEPAADDKSAKPTVSEVLDALLTAVTVTIPGILLEHEVTNQLSQLVDQTRKLGLTVDQYLSSVGKTADAIRAEYTEQSRRNLSLEFALEAIADKEGISVTDAEIDTLIKTAKNEEEKKAMESQKYYLASLVRRQKTVDSLVS